MPVSDPFPLIKQTHRQMSDLARTLEPVLEGATKRTAYYPDMQAACQNIQAGLDRIAAALAHAQGDNAGSPYSPVAARKEPGGDTGSGTPQ